MSCWKVEKNVRQQNLGDDGRQSPIVSFSEIMSEELAEQLQEEELNEFDEIQRVLEDSLKDVDVCDQDFKLALELSKEPDCSEDKLLALELQREFDREEELSSQFQQAAGKTTATLATNRHDYEKYGNEDTDESGDEDELRELATDQHYQYRKETFPPCGFMRNQNGEIITKHDKELNERNSCQRLFQSSSCLQSGDIIGERIALKIVNELEAFGKTEMKRKARVKDKDEKATSDASLDAKTRLIILGWINSGELDSVQGVVAMGKESTVLHGVLDQQAQSSSQQSPTEKHMAIKVYRQHLNAFRNRSEYVKNDFRFKNPRSVLKVWAEKEYMNLQRLNRASVPCPVPMRLKKNVLLMSMIGHDTPAPTLKKVEWTDNEQVVDAFEQTRSVIERMFKQCKLVHGDLSEFNLLYDNSIVYVIDVAQAVDVSHPRALEFLVRDVENMLDFFKKAGAEGLPTSQQMFGRITDLDIDESKELMPQVESFEHENRHLNMRLFKANPSECELSRMYSDQKAEESEHV